MKKSIYFILPIAACFLFSTQALFSQEENDSNFISESSDTLNEEGVSSAQSGNYDRAIKRFKKAVAKQDADVAISYNNLAYTYYLAGDIKEAALYYKKAIARNPNLTPALANLGKILYGMGEFAESIEHGEKVMRLSPGNKEVREWLPQAYQKAAEKRMYELSQEKETTEGPGLDSPVSSQVTKRIPNSKIELGLGSEFLIRKQLLKFTYFTPGGWLPLLYYLKADLWASPSLQIKVSLENPSYGLVFPFYMVAEEKLEFLFHTENIVYGFGAFFSQADFTNDTFLESAGFIANTAFPERTDTKLGLLIGFKDEFSLFMFSIYPRFLFSDPPKGPQSIEFDRNLISLEYAFFIPEEAEGQGDSPHLEFTIGMHFDEIFITEYLVPTLGAFDPLLNRYFDLSNVNPNIGTYSHYLGTYDIFFNMQIGKITKKFNETPTAFGFRIGKKLFLANIYNEEPFTFGTGQGYFGFHTQKTILGEPFPSIIGNLTYLDIYFKQMLFNQLILEEEIGFQYTELPINYNTLTLGLKVSFIF